MSRLPRHQEHLKTGFTAEAVSAAMFRAFAEQADGEGRANLADRWRRLAEAKDRLAIDQLQVAGRVRSDADNLRDAIAEEQFENEVLYPRLIDDLRHLGQPEEVELMQRVVEAQSGHLSTLDSLRKELAGSSGDVG